MNLMSKITTIRSYFSIINTRSVSASGTRVKGCRLPSGRMAKTTIAVSAVAALSMASMCPAQQIYSKVPSAASSGTYSVTVNGQPVPVELYGASRGNVSFARFAFSGSANIVVTVNQAVKSFTLSPKSYNIPAVVSGQTISFTLASPQRVVLRNVNTLSEELFLLADGPEANPPVPGAAGVTDALSRSGIDNVNGNNSAPGINQAINQISAAGGGTLFFPAGVYNIQSSINMKSNVTVYLSAGAVFQVAAYYNCCFTNQGVVNFVDVNNAKLTGRGILNGNAVNLPQSNRDFHMIYTENAGSIEIDDVLLLDQGVTGIRLVDAHNSAVRNIKIIADNPSTESDGIDFDSSQHILVDNVFIYSSDDNTSQGGGTGVRKTVKDQYDLTVQNSVLYNSRTGDAFKIGTTDPQSTINHITYSNIDVVQCVQLAAFYPTQGANLDSISINNVRVDSLSDRILEFLIEIPNWEPWNGKLGYIHNVSLTNVSVSSFGRRNSAFAAYDPNRDIANVNFTNYSVGGQSINSLSAAHIDASSYVNNVTFNSASASVPASPTTPPPTTGQQLPPVSSPVAGVIADGVFTLTNHYSNLMLDDPNFSTKPGEQIIQWSGNGGSNQKWKISANGNGFYTIQNVSSSMLLADGGGKLQQFWKSDDASQLWSISALGSGLYTFTNKSTGKMIDDPNLSKQQGVGMITWPANGGQNQLWAMK
jgi:Ricin-type beta-trefoil lectin domain-like/Glycosyl hydrolases family 28